MEGMREEYVQAYRHASAAGHARIMATLEEEGGVEAGSAAEQVGRAVEPGHAYVGALCLAAGEGHLRIMRALVEEGGVDVGSQSEAGHTALVNAAREGKVEAVRTLLTEWGADADQQATIIRGGHLRQGATALFAAACGGHFEVARVLLVEFGADVNKATTDNGATPLLIAADNGHVEVVRILVVEGKADVNKATTDDGGTTPLCHAAPEGHVEVVRILVMDGGADANKAALDSSTPLLLAARSGRADVIRILVVEGRARIDQPWRDPMYRPGYRAFHLAAHWGKHDACFVLCALGARMDLSLPEGQAPVVISNQPLAAWFNLARQFGSPLEVALERRDYPAALHLLRNRKIDRPTPRLVRERLLPIATTVGSHELARSVCDRTKRVAEVAAELYAGDRWSPKVHGFCTDQGRRDAVMGVMIIMLRKAGKGEGRVRPREGEGVEGASAGGDQQPPPQQQQHQQVQGLPRWMHEVPDDVWRKVLEMVGIW